MEDLNSWIYDRDDSCAAADAYIILHKFASTTLSTDSVTYCGVLKSGKLAITNQNIFWD
jgi:hypothetical protein